MPHPFDLDQLDFQPTRDTLKSWTKTRKEPMTIGGTHLSGLFRIDGYAADASLFVAVLVCEIFGLFNIVADLDDTLTAILIASLAIVFDWILAITHHNYKTGINCENRHKIAIADRIAESLLRNENIAITSTAISQRSTQLKARYQDEINRRERKAFWCAFAIWIIALAKVGTFFIANGFDMDMFVFAIVVSYGIAAYIHIYHTGYFYYGWRCYRAMKKAINDFNNNRLPTECLIKVAGQPEIRKTIITDAVLPTERTDRFHKIELIPTTEYDKFEESGRLTTAERQALNQGRRLYLFSVHSVLSDGALQRLSSYQDTNPDAIREILLTGLYIQYDQVGMTA